MRHSSHMVVVGVILLLLSLLVFPTADITRSQGEAHNWVALMYRIQMSNNVVYISLRYDEKTHFMGTILDIGTDYVCITNSGTTECIPYDAIGHVTTPPGTFGKTQDGR